MNQKNLTKIFYQFNSQYLSYIFLYLLLSFLITNCSTIQFNKNKTTKHVKESFYNNGQIEYKAEYFNNKLDGITTYWSIDGILISESSYSNGKPHGKWIKYHPNKNLFYEVIYFYGKKDGKEIWYYENGQIKSEQSFKNGKANSDIIRWYPNGKIIY